MMAEKDIYKLLDLLSSNGVANVQNGLILAIGLWLGRHVKGEAVESRTREAFSIFADTAIRVARQSQHRRKVWPEGKPLPFPNDQSKVQEAISKQVLRSIRGSSFEEGLNFFGELWGRWVLLCPEAIIRNSPEFANIAEATKNENELIEHMLRYLDLYGSM